jgi:hypothetical protein
MSSYKEKKLANSYSRKDFFELLETSFEIGQRRRDNYSNKEVPLEATIAHVITVEPLSDIRGKKIDSLLGEDNI